MGVSTAHTEFVVYQLDTFPHFPRLEMATIARSDSDPPPQPSSDSARSYTTAFRYLFFLTLLCVVVLNQVNIEAAFSITSPISDITTHSAVIPFDHIRSMEDALLWLREHIGGVLITTTLYDNCLGNFNKVISPFRIVQKRMKQKHNESAKFADFYPMVWQQSTLDMFDHSDCEDHTPYGYLELFQYDPDIGAMHEGGYGFSLNSFSVKELTADLLYLYNGKFVDRQTVTLYVDFVLYNGHLNVLTYVTMRFQGDQSGCVSSIVEIQPIKAEIYKTLQDIMRGVGEVLYVIVTVLFTGMEVYQFKVMFTARSLQLRKQSIQKKWVNSLKCAIQDYFADTWKYVDVACLCISYISISLWISLISSPFSSSQISDWSLLNNAMSKAELTRIYLRVNAFNFFLAFLHLIKYLEVFKRIALLRESLQHAGGEIAYFGALVSAVILSFVFSGHIALGTVQEDFSTFPKSLMECILIVFRGFAAVREVWKKTRVWTALFFIPYTVMVTMIFLNMFVAILSGAYKTSLDELERNKKGTLKEHVLFRIRRNLKKWLEKVKIMLGTHKIGLKKSKGSDQSKKTVTFGVSDLTEVSAIAQPTESALLHATSSDINLNFLDKKLAYDLQDVDSARRKETILVLAQRKKAVELLRALSYLLFVALAIGTLLWQQQINIGYSLQQAVKAGLSNASPDSSFEDIADFAGVRQWLQNSNNLFVKKNLTEYWINDKLYLIGQDKRQALRFTLRRLDLTPNPSLLFTTFAPMIRVTQGFDPGDRGQPENKTTFTANQHWFTYQENDSFGDVGGFVLYSSPGNFTSDLAVVASTFGDALNSVVLEYVIYCANVDYYLHVSYQFRFHNGGLVEKQLQIDPIRLRLYTSDSDKARGAFEALFCIALIYMISSSLSALKNNWLAYTVWQQELYTALTPALVKRRNRVKPEWLRKVKALLGPLVLMELLGYLSALTSIVLWAVLISFPDTADAAPFSIVGRHAQLQQGYVCTSSLCCLLLSLQLLDYFRLNSSLSVLQRTLSRASRDIFYYLIMFLTFWTAFAFMAYLAFGSRLLHYSTLVNSYKYCFQMMTRNYDYEELKRTDEVMAPLFFVVFMVFFVFVILNIFIAILERAYTHVTDSMRRNRTMKVSLWKSLKLLCRRKACAKSAEKQSKRVKLAPNLAYKLLNLTVQRCERPETWANDAASQILAERMERTRIVNEISLISKESSERKKAKQTQSSVEFQYRRRYWDYLRNAYKQVSEQSKEAIADCITMRETAERTEIAQGKMAARCKALTKAVEVQEKAVEEVTEQLPMVEAKLNKVIAAQPPSDSEESDSKESAQ